MRFGILSSLLSDPRGTLLVLLLALPGRMLAISAHESAHAWVADKCGDPTGRLMGRITLNPLAHLDPLGLVCMLLIGIGWAKPVGVNPRNFRNYRRDDLLVSIAGIAMNLILFVLGCVVYFTLVGFAFRYESVYMAIFARQSGVTYYLMEMLRYFIVTNFTLAIFNLIPLPPLDGWHVLNDLVLKRDLFATAQAVRMGQIILLVAMYTGILTNILSWAMGGAFSAMSSLAYGIYGLIGLV